MPLVSRFFCLMSNYLTCYRSPQLHYLEITTAAVSHFYWLDLHWYSRASSCTHLVICRPLDVLHLFNPFFTSWQWGGLSPFFPRFPTLLHNEKYYFMDSHRDALMLILVNLFKCCNLPSLYLSVFEFLIVVVMISTC